MAIGGGLINAAGDGNLDLSGVVLLTVCRCHLRFVCVGHLSATRSTYIYVSTASSGSRYLPVVPQPRVYSVLKKRSKQPPGQFLKGHTL